MLWLVALLCAGLFALGWWVSRPVAWLPRWLFRLSVLLLLVALALPPAGVDWVRDVLSLLIPLAREAGDVPGLSYVVHFLLFGAVSGLLFWTRADLGWMWPGLSLAALAFLMEGLQLLVAGRFASWTDVAANLSGLIAAALSVWALRKLRAPGM